MTGVVVAQVLAALLTVTLLHRLGLELLGPRAAALAALALAIDPASAVYAVQIQPEALFTLLVVAAVLAWVLAVRRASTAAAGTAGLCLGLAVLTRPIALFLPAVLAVVAVPPRGRRRLVLGLVGPALLLAGAWTARNALVSGVPVLSTIAGVNLLEYRAAGALARETGIPLEDAREQLRERLERESTPTANPALASRAQARLALQVLRENPRGALVSAGDGVLRLLSGTGLTALSRLFGDTAPEAITHGGKRWMALGLALWLAVLYLAAARGAVFLWQQGRRREVALLAALAAYFVLMAAGPEANTRFRVPAVPFLALLAAAGAPGVTTRPSRPEAPIEAW